MGLHGPTRSALKADRTIKVEKPPCGECQNQLGSVPIATTCHAPFNHTSKTKTRKCVAKENTSPKSIEIRLPVALT
jgi:hypothetical protein